jgi:hypothetical protein
MKLVSVSTIPNLCRQVQKFSINLLLCMQGHPEKILEFKLFIFTEISGTWSWFGSAKYNNLQEFFLTVAISRNFLLHYVPR